MSTGPESTAAQRPADQLAAPTGPLPVGRRLREWADPGRAEIYSASAEDRRELVMWLWYPAAPGPDTNRAAYLPAEWAPNGQFVGLAADGIRAHAVADAPLANDQPDYPVLVLTAGGLMPLLLTTVAEELASHGYVVAGVNHTYATAVTPFRDGRTRPMNPAAVAGALGPQVGSHTDAFRQRAAVCEYKAADLASAADELERLNAESADPFAGRLDLTRLGALGHSFGGDAALEWCRTDARCRAAANIDGALWTEVGRAGLDRPALQVLGQHGEFAISAQQAVQIGFAPNADWFEAEKAITFGGWRVVDQAARPAYTVQVKGATHVSFLDVAVLPLRDDAAVTAMLAAAGTDGRRVLRITADLLLGFFGRHLLDKDGQLLDAPSAAYAEVTAGPPAP